MEVIMSEMKTMPSVSADDLDRRISMRQAIKNLIDSIAREEESLGGLISAESGFVEKAKTGNGDLQSFIDVNVSVEMILDKVSLLQMALQFGLGEAKGLMRKYGDIENYSSLSSGEAGRADGVSPDDETDDLSEE